VALARRPSLTFDQSFMALQAAIDGHGVALAQPQLVAADIAASRLVAPFDLTLPADAGFYVVAPEATADLPKIALFRDWLLAEATARASRGSESRPRRR
jgi:LysR family transcriptional regulator, glycine cleavage system transcriptional activator